MYEELKKYRGILEMFYNNNVYVGGADDLMIKYNFKDQRCATCVATFLLEKYLELQKYDREVQSM